MFRFESASYFWLLFIIIVITFLFIKMLSWRKKGMQQLGTPRLSKQLLVGKIDGRATTKMTLIVGAIILSIFGLANLQAGDQSTVTTKKGVDVVFAMDISKSMLAKDISPDRLSRAKFLIQNMLGKMTDDKAGLVVFAGRAYLQSPITSDYGTLKMLLNAAGTSAAPTQGTVLSDAIQMSMDAFNVKDKKYKTIILISDGEDHDAEAVKLARKAADDGIIIHTVGVGSPQGATIFDPELGTNKLDANGNEVITKLNEEVLKEIAKASNGTYQLLANNNAAVNNLLQQINQMESRNLGSRMFAHYKSYYQYFIIGALLLLLLNAFIPAASSNKNFQIAA